MVIGRVLVIESAIEAQFPRDEIDLLLTARDAHRAAAFDLGNLPYERSHCSRRAGNDHSLTRLRVADIQ